MSDTTDNLSSEDEKDALKVLLNPLGNNQHPLCREYISFDPNNFDGDIWHQLRRLTKTLTSFCDYTFNSPQAAN